MAKQIHRSHSWRSRLGLNRALDATMYRLHRRRPRRRALAPRGAGPLACVVAYNEYGAFCVPRASMHRPVAQRILAGDVWERDTIAVVQRHARAGDIVHAGTYFGDLIPAFAHACDADARVWAFEPNPENFQCAGITVALNSLTNVTLTHGALTSQSGSVQLVTHDMRGRPLGGTSTVVDARAPGKVIGIPGLAIDDVIPRERVISVIQLDVEDHEREALEGAMQSIRLHRPVIILESPPDPEWISQHLEPLGYRYDGEVDRNVVFLPQSADCR